MAKPESEDCADLTLTLRSLIEDLRLAKLQSAKHTRNEQKGEKWAFEGFVNNQGLPNDKSNTVA